MKKWIMGLAIMCLAVQVAMSGEKIKIGYLVKQPDEPWFQMEWKGAQKVADKYGFELIKVGIPDGEKTLSAIDQLAAGQAQGFVICIPDVRLGPAVINSAKRNNLKFMVVNDQFVNADGSLDNATPMLGMSAKNIGNLAGQSLVDEAKKRGWDFNAPDFAVAVMSFDELDTIHQRTSGVIEKLIEGGVPQDKIINAPIAEKMEIPTSFNAANILLTQHPEIKRWLVCGGNDNSVLGAIRAMENRKLGAENVIGVGINGTDCWAELKKPSPTGFFGSILADAPGHGGRTTEFVYKWVVDGTPPPQMTYTSGELITRDNFVKTLIDKGWVTKESEIQ